MILHNLISLTLYGSFIIYAMFGAYSLILNKDARLNRVFSILCFCFAIWGFTFAVFNSADSYGEAMLWRRISVLGWGVAYSLILHFIIVLTESNWSKQEKRPILLLALYLPAAFNIFVFGLYSNTAIAQLQLVRSVAGWTTLPVNNGLDMLFYLYYIGFSIVFLSKLFSWYRTTSSPVNKKKAFLMLITFGIALTLGSLTDLLANAFLVYKLPSLAPVVIMIPVATIFYIINNYGLMRPFEQRVEDQEGIILNTDSRVKLFKYISLVLVIGSVINFYTRIVLSDNNENAIIFSFILTMLAVIISIIPYLIKSVRAQEALLAALLIITMPVVMFTYSDVAFSNIIWAVPVFAIMITVIFNNKRIFYGVAWTSILIGIVLWKQVASYGLIIDTRAHIFRLFFYAIGFSLTLLIRKIYGDRLKENAMQEKFQKMVAGISANFVTMNRFDYDVKVTDLLKRSGSFIGVDRATIGMFSEDLEMVQVTHEWVDKKLMPEIDEMDSIPQPAQAWSMKQLMDNQIVYIPTLDTLPKEAEEESEWLRDKSIRSRIYIPIPSRNSIVGFIGFDQTTKEKKLRLNDYEGLRVLANILADAIGKVESEIEMENLAYYDALTKLPNRVLFENRLEQSLSLAKRTEKYLGVMFMDIDGFKEVNDTLGHDWGDHVLIEIGKRLTDSVRKYDTVARFGGDEFLVMVPQITRREDLNEIAKKITRIFDQPVIVGEQEFYIKASGGISIFPEDGETVNTLIKNADLAMYAAKKNGKGQVVFCSVAMKEAVIEKTTLTNSLYRALERNELHLAYQPQVCVKTQEIIGFEALLRWNHPKLGMIPPAVFIPIAEQTGLINNIGEWVLTTACAQNKAWQDKGFKPVQMAVNLSLEQFRSGNVENIVRECLAKTGLKPQYLELEITEGIAMKESQYVVNCLHGLKTIGVAISIDDFGTEFSSLSRLKDLPVDRLKIDMQFIKGIGMNTKDESIIAVMIHLAKRLGLKVIAEGVETVGQLGFLRDENCDEIQGYYYYKPMSKDAIEGELDNLKNLNNHNTAGKAL